MKLVYWGTYDLGKPRNRINIRGLRDNGVQVVECHKDLWQGVEDKSQISTLGRISFLVLWLCAYPRLLVRYMRVPTHEAVVVGYLGHLDVLLLWPFAKLRGVPLVWDAFLSLYDTVVNDRRLVHRYNPLAVIIYVWEWLACRAADRIVLDTRAHAELFQELYRVPEEKMQVALVGAEPEAFSLEAATAVAEQKVPDQPFIVLFYGQFIPLHGIETIIEAAKLLTAEYMRFVIIGKGQEEEKIRALLGQYSLQNVDWRPWVVYEELIDWIHKSDVCLGIFGDTDKASRVIPNKVYQVISAGKPLVTRDSPAIRELLSPEMDPVFLVREKDPAELAHQLRSLAQSQKASSGSYPETVRERISPVHIGAQLVKIIAEVTKGWGK